MFKKSSTFLLGTNFEDWGEFDDDHCELTSECSLVLPESECINNKCECPEDKRKVDERCVPGEFRNALF